MEQIVVKTEMQANGEILLFYVDENEAQSVGIENQLLQQIHEGTNFEIQELDEAPEPTEESQAEEVETSTKDKWTEDEVKRLLVFFIDNSDSFGNGTTKKKHLWSVACKTMLIGKSPQTCEVKLRNLKRKYSMMLLAHQNGTPITWPLFELCHQAFHNDTYIQFMLREQSEQEQKVVKVPIQKQIDDSGVIVVKNVNTKSGGEANVQLMLTLYLRYKNNFQKDYWRKGLWQTIAMELGEEDAEYWQKRFLNFKQHYLRLVAKRQANGSAGINWPYMELFDQIFQNDPEFQRKYSDGSKNNQTDAKITSVEVFTHNEWNDTEATILAKYYFDCFDEFQDSTIPDHFLWNEVGRLLDKKPENCRQKFNDLRQAHIEKYVQGGYSLRSRNPLAIILDNIVSKETELELNAVKYRKGEMWQTEEIDELVQFLYENIEMFKDHVCYYVCWSTIAYKLDKSVHACKKQWDDLKKLYKSTLDDKKENPDLQIDWRYIELFDRIFDYGMDTNLLTDFKQHKESNLKVFSPKIGVKRVNIKMENDPTDMISDEEEFDERGFTKRVKRGVGDSKAFKILEFFQKNKEKFSTTQRKKQALWEMLARQIGLTGEQCAHRFRNLKQVYTTYVQREINKPEMPILWPYYALCKKVFGYRAIKSKLKNNRVDSEDSEEWAAKEIKQIINYYANNFVEISSSDDNDMSKWTSLAQLMGKSEHSVNEKFLELQRSYRKLKSMKENNPECKVSWKYYNLFDEVYNKVGSEMEVEELELDEVLYEEETVTEEIEKADGQDDEDYQCLIVLPEGQDISDISDAQIIIQQENEETETPQTEELEVTDKKPVLVKWTKKMKKRLLIAYLNGIRSRRGTEVRPKDLWAEIYAKFPDRPHMSCMKMFSFLKSRYIQLANADEETKKKYPYYNLLQKIMNIKTKFVKKNPICSEDGRYKDFLLPTAKVELALQYYLQHIEEFNSPKYEKKYIWNELATFVSVPVNKLFNKINYLKQYYDGETNKVNGEKTLFAELLTAIVNKENELKSSAEPETVISYGNEEIVWTDSEIEQLLVWYLTNLDKFKNPKFVRKYLWIEASSILEKSPLACSKKMIEIRTQYKTMINENPNELNEWRFFELCQKIYGTGKKIELPSKAEKV